MKNIFKIIGVITIALIIGFSYAACSSPESSVEEEENPNTPDAVAVTGVSLKTSTGLIVGGTETLTAAITPSNATNKNVTWSSSNAAIASVSTGGEVTGVSAGTAIITVTTVDGGKTASCTVMVSTTAVAVTGVSLKTSTGLAVGDTETLFAAITPSNATNQNVTWNSSNTAVASVSAGGVVTGVSAGTAIITVTTVDGGKTAQCTVTVTSGGGDSSTNAGGKYNTIYLKANSWNNENGESGENWSSGTQIKLSDFTDIEPKRGDILQFKISGVSDKEIKYFRMDIYQLSGDGLSTYRWLGESDKVVLPKTFNNSIFDISVSIWGDYEYDSNAVIYIDLLNMLWQKNSSGEYLVNSGETIPAGVKNDDVMATISNFSVSVAKVDYSYTETNGEITFNRYGGKGGNVIIPAQINGKPVTRIGGWAFYGCESLTGVTIPNSVTSIGEDAFANCTSLTSVTFTATSKVTGIGNYAFYGCESLTSVTIPNSVISIGFAAFYGCESLTGVTIPNSVTSIESFAFYWCTSLTSVTFQGTIAAENLGSNVTFDDNSTSFVSPFNDDLLDKYLAGGIGTYTRETNGYTWTKQ
jgi:Bacterial surface proteins containing Ig-like domains